MLLTKLCAPQNQYVETLTPNMIVFEDRAFKEVIKVKKGLKSKALI